MRNQTELPLLFTTPATGAEQALLVGPGETLTFESRVQGEADGEAVDRGVAETGNRFTPEPEPEPEPEPKPEPEPEPEPGPEPEPEPKPEPETRARARTQTRTRNPSPSPNPAANPEPEPGD